MTMYLSSANGLCAEVPAPLSGPAYRNIPQVLLHAFPFHQAGMMMTPRAEPSSTWTQSDYVEKGLFGLVTSLTSKKYKLVQPYVFFACGKVIRFMYLFN